MIFSFGTGVWKVELMDKEREVDERIITRMKI